MVAIIIIIIIIIIIARSTGQRLLQARLQPESSSKVRVVDLEPVVLPDRLSLLGAGRSRDKGQGLEEGYVVPAQRTREEVVQDHDLTRHYGVEGQI